MSRPPVEIKLSGAVIGTDWMKTSRDAVAAGDTWIAYTEPPLPSVGSSPNQRIGSKINLKNWRLRFFPSLGQLVDGDNQNEGGYTKFWMALVVLKKGSTYNQCGPPDVLDFFEKFDHLSIFAGYGGWGPMAKRRNPSAGNYDVLWSRWFPRDFPNFMQNLRSAPWTYTTAGVQIPYNRQLPVALNFKLKNSALNWDITTAGAPDYDRLFFVTCGVKSKGAVPATILEEDPTVPIAGNNQYGYTELYFRDA